MALERFIARTLRESQPSEDGFVAEKTNDGMVVKIWYHTIGDENILTKYEIVTAEEWDWEQAGCKNNREWRAHLNKMIWRENCAGLRRN